MKMIPMKWFDVNEDDPYEQGSHTFFIFKFKDFSRTFQGLTGDFQGLINTKFQDFSRLN